jgi:hypothetical protein
MDAGDVEKTNDVARGRRSRVVLTPRRWCQARRKCPAGDGGKKARFTGESTKETVKTIRAGNAGVFGATCGYLLVCFFHTTRGRGWWLKHPAFPAPSSSGEGDA